MSVLLSVGYPDPSAQICQNIRTVINKIYYNIQPFLHVDIMREPIIDRHVKMVVQFKTNQNEELIPPNQNHILLVVNIEELPDHEECCEISDIIIKSYEKHFGYEGDVLER